MGHVLARNTAIPRMPDARSLPLPRHTVRAPPRVGTLILHVLFCESKGIEEEVIGSVEQKREKTVQERNERLSALGAYSA
jgi:hypothetical protein